MSDAESNVGSDSDSDGSILIEEGSAGSLNENYDYVEDAEAFGNDEFYWDATTGQFLPYESNDLDDSLHLSDLSQSNMDDPLHMSDLSHSNMDDSLHMRDLISESNPDAPTPGSGSLPVNRGGLDEAPSPSSVGSLGLESTGNLSVGNLSVVEEGVESELDPEDLDSSGVSLNDSSGVDVNVNKRLFEESQAQLEESNVSQASEYIAPDPLMTPEGSDFEEGSDFDGDLENSFNSLHLSPIRRRDEESEDEMDDAGELDKSDKSELHKIRLRF